MNAHDPLDADAPALALDHVTKRFPGFVLDDVSLTVPRGYVTGLVGANGAGKTTAIKLAVGLVRPDAGTVTALLRERVGIVVDTLPYPGEWRVGDVTRATARFYPTWNAERLASDLAGSGVTASKKIKDLSRGMGMRLALALALAPEPDLLILDEPTAGLDPAARDDLRARIADFMTDERHAVLFSTHMTTDLERLADYVTVLSNGRVFAADTLEGLKASWRLVSGPPATLSDGVRDRTLGLRASTTGWQGLMRAEDAESLPGIVLDEPTLDQLAAHIAKEYDHA